eukprot:CAMPEP_0168479468 /NCGR_PEP_ID=MMETSP0228-20121227/63487_1 /TAXON_ID=133427 /ORGANISM="Protoceratium reticulatum, Strain CCCM 535 (=CCMP 1889)" /LENGTH=41 /DNA_ID= /DNA_START= /DNA_END= /DNA_ORIENTATION=
MTTERDPGIAQGGQQIGELHAHKQSLQSLDAGLTASLVLCV